MRRRGRASRRPGKGQRRSATESKAHKTPAAHVSTADLQLNRRTQERDGALEQLTATSEVLSIIRRSPTDAQPVFDAIVQSAARLCGAIFSAVYLYDGDCLSIAATKNFSPQATKQILELPEKRRPHRSHLAGRAILDRAIAHVHDVLADPEYSREWALAGGWRAVLAVPLLSDGKPVGALSVAKAEPIPFSDQQIQLLNTFADQAVIAIENVRLFETEQKRTRELSESLEQQTATSEVLSVISSSPGELEPVFKAMLENAARLCEARYGTMWLCEGDAFRAASLHGPLPPAYIDLLRSGTLFRAGPDTPTARAVQTRQPVQVLDLRETRTYLDREPVVVAAVEVAGVRTMFAVPMLKDNELVGVIAIYRQEVRPFTDKQIELVQNFAAQAVIAIENTRLLNELRESLQQQTATADVLKVISSSPGELGPVFQAMLENATRICEAKFGIIFQFDGESFERTADVGTPPIFAEFLKRQGRFKPLQGSHLDRIMRTKQVSHTADYAAEGIPSPPVKLGGARSTVDLPMLKDNQLIGAFSIYRQEVRPFTDKQIALLTNFAAQAVIAIENARLLKELRERTRELEAQSQEVVKLNQQLERRVADQVGEIERMGRLRRFLPPQVADLIIASGTEKQLESHRREITALFCDLRGFTGFSESSDPEDVMSLLRDYHAAIGEIIIKYSGTLERYAGDGVMVVFNDPVPVQNPALQAVLMALDMRTAIGTLIEKWRRLGHELGFGIGIAHGFATLGTIGFEGRFDYAAIGTVSNVASRLCDEAKPGQILISPRVLIAVEDAVTVEPVGDFTLKGISRPVAAYNVLSAVSSKI
jgi:class 3 adenylate cyclase/putative methionine-R-sulfoxide reductase with GAF domain